MKRSELSETRAWEKDSGGPVKVVCHTLILKHTHRVISKSSDYRDIFTEVLLLMHSCLFVLTEELQQRVYKANTGNGNI